MPSLELTFPLLWLLNRKIPEAPAIICKQRHICTMTPVPFKTNLLCKVLLLGMSSFRPGDNQGRPYMMLPKALLNWSNSSFCLRMYHVLSTVSIANNFFFNRQNGAALTANTLVALTNPEQGALQERMLAPLKKKMVARKERPQRRFLLNGFSNCPNVWTICGLQ